MRRRALPAVALGATIAVLLAGCSSSGEAQGYFSLNHELALLWSASLGMLALLGIPVGLVGIVILGLTLRAVRAGRPVRQGTLVVGVVVLAAFTAIALVITIFVVATGGPHETYYAPFR